MKKFLCGILAVMSILTLFTACKSEPIKEPPEVGFLVADQFNGYRLGIVDGLVDKKDVTDNITSPEIVDFNTVDKGLSALRGGKLHGLVLPAPESAYALGKYSDISKLYIPLIKRELCAISLSNNKFAHGINAAITTMQNDGMADRIATTHSGKGKSVRPTNYDKLEGRVLRVGMSEKVGAPLFYKDKNGEFCGINVDSAYVFAKGIHADLVISVYPNDEALFKALDTDEIDLAMSNFVPSEENPISTKYLYTHPYCDNSIHIIINGETPRVATEGLSALGK